MVESFQVLQHVGPKSGGSAGLSSSAGPGVRKDGIELSEE